MYYRLTYTASSNKGSLGDSILNGNKPLNIGQGAACDVLLPDSEMFEPQLYASILADESNTEWFLVKRTDCHKVLINGTEVPVAQRLNNGDRLSFSDGNIHAELKFETFNDGEYDASSGFVYKKHKSNNYYFLTTVIGVLLAFGIAAYALWGSRSADIRRTDWKQYGQYVYHVTVDSVYLLCDSLIDGEKRYVKTDSIELAEVSAGTAFLTLHGDDTLFVTARHCIEPWINDEEWDGVSSKEKMSPELRLATKAETENRLAGYEKYILRAHCVISKGLERYDYYSTDFYMNKSRDMVMRLGTEKEVIYWRTIIPIAHRRDMELGDFAYIKASNLTKEDGESLISLAEWDDIKTFTKSSNHDIAVIGYPLNDNDADEISVVYGNYTGLEFNDSLTTPTGCMQLSVPINRGNSGGPILALIENKIKVIGIVSKADGRANQGMFWAVPISEVADMHKQGNTVKVDAETYRR